MPRHANLLSTELGLLLLKTHKVDEGLKLLQNSSKMYLDEKYYSIMVKVKVILASFYKAMENYDDLVRSLLDILYSTCLCKLKSNSWLLEGCDEKNSKQRVNSIL